MFDLDGTLADTARDLANAVNYFRRCFALEPIEERAVPHRVGRGVEYLVRSFLPDDSVHRLEEAMELFLEHYEGHLLDSTVLYPHVREVLEHFESKKKVVVSNKIHRLTVSVLRGLGIEGSFDAIFGSDSLLPKKPDPEALNQVLASFHVSPARALMVGDGAVDIEAGKGAGVYTCGVTYGMGKREELVAARPDFLVDDLKQLSEYFR